MRNTSAWLLLLAVAALTEAQENKYLLVACDDAYTDLAHAEGRSRAGHVHAMLEPVREYLSGRSFWLRFHRGFIIREWHSPPSGRRAVTFLEDLTSDFRISSGSRSALCVGLTGRYNSSRHFGWGWIGGSRYFARHSVVFYGTCRSRAVLHGRSRLGVGRATASHEMGHNFSGHHHPDRSRVTCALDNGDLLDGVYRYCGTHLAKFRAYQRSRGSTW